MDLSIIRIYRKQNKILQREIAKRISISQAYLSLIELNKKVPTISVLEDICNDLELELRIIPKI